MADNHAISERIELILLAQHRCELHSLLVHCIEVFLILEVVLADFKRNMRVIRTALRS